MFRLILSTLILSATLTANARSTPQASFSHIEAEMRATHDLALQHPGNTALSERTCKLIEKLNKLDFNRALSATGGIQYEIDYCF